MKSFCELGLCKENMIAISKLMPVAGGETKLELVYIAGYYLILYLFIVSTSLHLVRI